MNSDDRARIKRAVLHLLEEYGDNFSLPFQIKRIVHRIPNIRLISYSKHMRLENLTYDEMVSITQTDDACADYCDNGNYIIFYNDLERKKVNSYRYRWNIAHELGHIFLDHHKTHPETRIFRNNLSKATYKKLEDEADMFASYLLVPHIVLLCLNVIDSYEIAERCQISGTAAIYRSKDLSLWRRRNRSVDYDFSLINLYVDFIESSNPSRKVYTWLNRYRKCFNCSSRFPLPYIYCPVCGRKDKRKYFLEIEYMKYEGIQTDSKGRAIDCPNCHNTDIAVDGGFCIICGKSIINYCSDATADVEPSDYSCSHSEPLSGNARYCPFCGNKTTYYRDGILPPWNQKITYPPVDFSNLDDDPEDEILPF